MSELDKIFAELNSKRSEQERERRARVQTAADFLGEFFERDIKSSETLRRFGIEAHFGDNKIVLHKPQAGHYADPLYIAIGEQGEIDVGGRSFGRYQPADKDTKKRELIGEIIAFFDL
jgi:hypothetical protein